MCHIEIYWSYRFIKYNISDIDICMYVYIAYFINIINVMSALFKTLLYTYTVSAT